MNHIGVEQVFEVKGRRYRLGRLTRGVLRAWLQWADSQVPTPLELAWRHLDDYPCPEILVKVADEANARRFTPDDPTTALELTELGQFEFFCLLMDPYHWHLSRRKLWRLFSRINWPMLLQKAGGVAPTDEGEAETDMYRALGWLPPLFSQNAATAWADIDRSIFQNCYITPEVVDSMTLAELRAVLKPEKKEQSVWSVAAAVSASPTRFYHSLTPEQKLTLSAKTYGHPC
jgi:hypothetical protein